MSSLNAALSDAGAADISTRGDYLERMRFLLMKLFPSDGVGWNFVDRGRGSIELYGEPAELYDNRAVAALLLELDDHPIVNSYLSEPPAPELQQPRRLSDVISEHDFAKTRTHSELFRPFGVSDQLTIMTARPDGGSGSCWTINRDTGRFTDDEVAVAIYIQPLLAMTDALWSNISRLDLAPETSLTKREVQILTLLSTGSKATAVAHNLGIAESTVAKHIEHIYRKLNCNDRVNAVDRARAAGIIPRLPRMAG